MFCCSGVGFLAVGCSGDEFWTVRSVVANIAYTEQAQDEIIFFFVFQYQVVSAAVADNILGTSQTAENGLESCSRVQPNGEMLRIFSENVF